MKPGARPPLKSVRLLDQVRERIRYCHYSLRTEQAYLFWVRRFIRFNRLRHPRSMGCSEVEAFLTHLATERHVAPSTHKQALAALLFLYRQVLDIELPWMQQIGRPKSPVRIPVVLSRAEVARLLEHAEPKFAPIIALLYGAGLRLMECLALRVKDVDFDRKIVIVREGKGRKDRVVMLPEPLGLPLRRQLERSRALWQRIAPIEFPVSTCRMHSLENIHAPARVGLGIGYFRPLPYLSTLALAFVADIISTSKAWAARLRVRWQEHKSRKG